MVYSDSLWTNEVDAAEHPTVFKHDLTWFNFLQIEQIAVKWTFGAHGDKRKHVTIEKRRELQRYSAVTHKVDSTTKGLYTV